MVGSEGLQLKGHPATLSIMGRILDRALTSKDFPEPFGPEIIAPPMVGSTVFKMRAFFAFPCPAMAGNG